MAYNLLLCDREQGYLMPPSLREWLAEGDLAWFILDAVDQIDLGEFYAAYRSDGWGAAVYDPVGGYLRQEFRKYTRTPVEVRILCCVGHHGVDSCLARCLFQEEEMALELPGTLGKNRTCWQQHLPFNSTRRATQGRNKTLAASKSTWRHLRQLF